MRRINRRLLRLRWLMRRILNARLTALQKIFIVVLRVVAADSHQSSSCCLPAISFTLSLTISLSLFLSLFFAVSLSRPCDKFARVQLHLFPPFLFFCFVCSFSKTQFESAHVVPPSTPTRHPLQGGGLVGERPLQVSN